MEKVKWLQLGIGFPGIVGFKAVQKDERKVDFTYFLKKCIQQYVEKSHLQDQNVDKWQEGNQAGF